jgi:hypothetical protein
MAYPENDSQFEEAKISSVKKYESSWCIERDDGWSFSVDSNSPVVPEVGMTARFYGKGIGYVVRGLYLDGKKVFYRSEEEQEKHFELETYGKDAQEWLNRWDEGRSVWSVSMGGFGPGYEQAIQIAAVEVVRFLLEKAYDASLWSNAEVWKGVSKEIETEMFNRLDKLGLSGAQYGASVNLATVIYRQGPAYVKSAPSDRQIQVSKNFPSL